MTDYSNYIYKIGNIYNLALCIVKLTNKTKEGSDSYDQYRT